ncbi:MAG: alcohol dehydrogenase catalytic domain-containing protein, partial [Microlunatus sp.]|nr:alcohol dehydrogenase catalytic domain-containing protein [Microlunatus sp.]
RALVLHGPRDARVDRVAVPQPALGELLVRIELAGICGTDGELAAGTMAYFARGLTHFPLRPGHEWTGTVVAAGSASEGLWVGCRVVGDTMLGCGTCPACRGGRHHVCRQRREVGITDGWLGALSEYAVVPTRFAHYVPDSVAAEAAVLVEPGANALRAVRAAESRPGSTLLILGDGTIGLLAALFAVDAGAEVTVCGLRPDRLALAGRIGARHTLTTDTASQLPRSSYDAVLDATDDSASPASALDLVRPGGRVALIGLAERSSTIDTRDLVLSDVAAVGILSGSPALADTLRAYASGLDPTPVVGDIIALTDVPVRLAGLTSSGPGPKTLVDPWR